MLTRVRRTTEWQLITIRITENQKKSEKTNLKKKKKKSNCACECARVCPGVLLFVLRGFKKEKAQFFEPKALFAFDLHALKRNNYTTTICIFQKKYTYSCEYGFF